MTDANGNMAMPVAPYGGGSYADGYSQGYSEGMRQASGGYPMPYDYRPRY